MPSRVRLFWWLNVVIVGYWAVTAAWFLIFPPDQYLATLAHVPPLHIPPHLREEARRVDILQEIVRTTFNCVVTLGLAWLAAFRRQNWARWIYALTFLFRLLFPYIAAAYVYFVPAFDPAYRRAFVNEFLTWRWGNPISYMIAALIVIAIATVFSGNAREWFRPTTLVA